MDNKELEEYLRANNKLNFVRRILMPDDYPVLKNKDSSYSTHEMAWANDDKGYYVYPTIIYDNMSGELKRLSPDFAYQYAKKTGEYLQFKTKEEADWFSKNYKNVWNKKEKEVKKDKDK